MTDPEEGTYTCKVTWWADYYEFPERQSTANITYLIPTDETTRAMGWDSAFDTRQKYQQTLSVSGSPSANFNGRKVREMDPGGGQDGCYRQDDPFLPLDKVTNKPTEFWTLVGNAWGTDNIGYSYLEIKVARQERRVPCETTFRQDMEINIGTTGWRKYRTNTLRAGVPDARNYWVERDGVRAEKEYLTGDEEMPVAAGPGRTAGSQRGVASGRERRGQR